MKKNTPILVLGLASAWAAIALPFIVGAALVSTKTALGIYTVIGLVLVAATEATPRRT